MGKNHAARENTLIMCGYSKETKELYNCLYYYLDNNMKMWCGKQLMSQLISMIIYSLCKPRSQSVQIHCMLLYMKFKKKKKSTKITFLWLLQSKLSISFFLFVFMLKVCATETDVNL